MSCKASLTTQPYTLRRGWYRLVLANGDERVSLLVRFVVIVSERDVIVRVEVTSDVCKCEPAHLDETEEGFGTQ